MKVHYSNLKIIPNLLFTIIWSLVCAVKFYFAESIFSWWSLLFLSLIILFWSNFLVIIFKKYFIIDDDKIVLMGFRNKIIEFKNLTEIKTIGDYYIFKDSKNKIIEISKLWMNEKKIPIFDERFQKLKNNFENKNQISL